MDPYKQPSHTSNPENTTPIALSKNITREEKLKLDGKEENHRAGAKVLMLLVVMRKSHLREQMISHTNNQPSNGFYDSIRLNSKSDEEVK